MNSGALIDAEFTSELFGTAGLWVLAAIALWFTLRRPPVSVAGHAEAYQRLGWLTLLVVVIQAVHFTEEWVMGFYYKWPGRIHMAPWSQNFFVALNAVCFAVWLFSVPVARRGRRSAFFPLWFLALAMISGGIGEPLLAIGSGSYFPGLWTAPFAALFGFLLWRQLKRTTAVG
jgi:hypothetical protein